MKCEHCNVNDATFLYEENINGNKRSLRLCADCAAKLQAGKLFGDGIEALSIPSFAKMQENFLDGLFGFSPKHPSTSTQKACPGCGASWAELLQKGKAFCPTCYTTFGEELQPTVRSLHGNVTHVGRAPAGRRAQKEKRDRLATLKAELAKAISEEKFEDAAKLRDEIRTLEKE